ncbi:MAG: hypothetical protein ACOZCL_11780 [Bacillota bacterium]
MNSILRMKKTLPLLFIVTCILLISFIAFTLLLKSSAENNFSESTDEIIKNIEDNKSELNYKDFIEIQMKDSELIFNKTTEAQTTDNEFCNLMYDVRFVNISNEAIKFKYKMFIPREMSEKIIVTDLPYEALQADTLVPGKGTSVESGRIMIHYNKLDQKTKEIFHKFKNTLYFEFHINGKKCYVKYTK